MCYWYFVSVGGRCLSEIKALFHLEKPRTRSYQPQFQDTFKVYGTNGHLSHGLLRQRSDRTKVPGG